MTHEEALEYFPLPWHVDTSAYICPLARAIAKVNGNNLAVIEFDPIGIDVEYDLSRPEKKELAKASLDYIVTACNAYPNLIKLLTAHTNLKEEFIELQIENARLKALLHGRAC